MAVIIVKLSKIYFCYLTIYLLTIDDYSYWVILYIFFSQVVNQYYDSEVVTEYVIRGNTAILKCTIPSFVADFVIVNSWITSDGQEYRRLNKDYIGGRLDYS